MSVCSPGIHLGTSFLQRSRRSRLGGGPFLCVNDVSCSLKHYYHYYWSKLIRVILKYASVVREENLVILCLQLTSFFGNVKAFEPDHLQQPQIRAGFISLNNLMNKSLNHILPFICCSLYQMIETEMFFSNQNGVSNPEVSSCTSSSQIYSISLIWTVEPSKTVQHHVKITTSTTF